MRHDPGSNFNLLEVYAAAALAVSTVVTSSVDHGQYGRAVSYMISVGTFATGLVATLQHSATLATDYIDEVAGLGNDVSVTFATAEQQSINCPNPREQFTRVKLVATGALILCVQAVAGPITSIIPPDGVEE